MRFLFAPVAIPLIALTCAAPASSAVLMQEITGVLLPGTDDAGVLGTPGADLEGVPFAYRVFLREEDYFLDSGDYSGSIYRASGRIGDLRIPFHAATGGIGGYQTPEGPFYISVRPSVYPGISADVYLDYPGDGMDWSQFSTIDLLAPESAGGAPFASGSLVSLSSVTPVTGAIPEPATWLLLLSGFGAIGFVLRRRSTRLRLSYS